LLFFSQRVIKEEKREKEKECARMTLESACPEIGLHGWHSVPVFGALFIMGRFHRSLKIAEGSTFKRLFIIIIIIIKLYKYINLLKYKLTFSILVVPETASGLQGEQPLVHGVK
jgi:hypothetical protein